MDLDEARKHAGLNPLPTSTDKPEAKPEVITEDATIGNEELIRGIPAVGRVSGTMKHTRPGDPAWRLDEAGRDILKANLHRNRFKPDE